MNGNIRTDLAVEAEALRRGSAGETTALPGVKARSYPVEGFPVTEVEVLSPEGEAAIGKPAGRYVTLELDAVLRREEHAFPDACRALASLLRPALPPEGPVLVIGLGNRDITPDAVGPEAVEHVFVTRHLRENLPEDFGRFRSVAAVCTGVLGTTGIESRDLVRSVTEEIAPAAVVAVDALASREPGRLCRTVQLSDTGIVPGSGVGNARSALNRETLGVPVIALGVPTVVDAATLTLDLAARAGARLDPEALGEAGRMIVTPREIDRRVRDVSRLIGYALNLALHEGLTVEDVDLLLG